MKKLVLSCVVVLTMSGMVLADTFGIGANQFDIDFVMISGSTNPAGGIPAGDGFVFTGVNNDYCMGTYEITNDQWNKFVAASGTVTGSPSNAYDESAHWAGTNVATNELSWYEGAQFINWLNTSTGHQAAYKFTGAQGTGGYTFAVWESGDPGYDVDNPYRNSNAFYFMPTEDEWVKAAYWNGTSLQTYATKDGSKPDKWTATGGANLDGQSAGWNYEYAYPDNTLIKEPWDVTAGYSPEELSGTYDMMGNVYEWTESPYSDPGFEPTSNRSVRGGSLYSDSYGVRPSHRYSLEVDYESYHTGFRVASVVPEPCSMVLLALGGLGLLRRRRG